MVTGLRINNLSNLLRQPIISWLLDRGEKIELVVDKKETFNLKLVMMSASHAAPGEVGKHCPSPSTRTNQSRMDLGCRRIEKSNLVIKELLKEKDEEKERLNGVIAGLLADKEKDKVDKDVMLNRMSQIEATLTAMVRR
ncbi:uncharacterized protein LOC110935977 [Helianthus annuus]|uniref:uncharacterized protein LOC110935977 n=1 Tax=Helianthus annuus TaxID=4232 RepID=UPI000B8F25FB|nr:uncharacterized protein LOC110935977 [Helianthus annuus]